MVLVVMRLWLAVMTLWEGMWWCAADAAGDCGGK